MTEAEQRAALAAAIEQQGESLAALSRMLGRNVAWLHQYFTRGTPRMLPEEARRRLASYLGLSEEALGGRAAPALIPRLDIGVSAGPGRIADAEEVAGDEPISDEGLRRLGAKRHDLRWLRVEGDSMEPLLDDGDRILVDRGRRRPGASDGALWVIRVEGALSVKRVQVAARGMRIVSVNPAYPPVERPAREVEVLGRVVRMMRDL